MDKTQLTSKDLSQRLSKRLANFKLKDDVIVKLAERVLVDGWEIKKINVCPYGICIDYFTDKAPMLERFLSKNGVRKLEMFPYGIFDPDLFHIQVSFAVDELEGLGGGGSLGR